MPNRIIKESIHTSETVNAMTDFQFRLWISLITYVDDYGRGDARPAVIKGTCFPLRERITIRDINAALTALSDIGCVGLYEVDGKPYLYLTNWESHQRIRQKVSRCPAPVGSVPPQLAADGGNSPQPAATRGLNPNPNPNTKSEYRIRNPESEREEEEEPVDAGARAREELSEAWNYYLGRTAPKGLADTVANRAAANGFERGVITRAVELASTREAGSPSDYFIVLLGDWQARGIRTVDQLDRYLAERDMENGRVKAGN